ncbi:MAG: Esterase EstD [Phenylobacterium sp.]|nr:Esterase EstD [Phenylobacterium sp.]
MPIIKSAQRLAFGCAAGLFLVTSAAAAQTRDGDYAGAIKLPSGQELHLVLHLTTKGGDTDATLDSLDQGVTIPSSAYKADGDKVSILFLAVGGELEGAFSADGKSLVGAWKQGLAMPLTLTKTVAAAPAKP